MCIISINMMCSVIIIITTTVIITITVTITITITVTITITITITIIKGPTRARCRDPKPHTINSRAYIMTNMIHTSNNNPCDNMN